MALVQMIVNGTPRSAEVPPETTLLKFLHDDIEVPDVHSGCEEGACGVCTVLLDGKSVKACTLKADACQGRTVTTLAGLTDPDHLFELELAFLPTRARQCGICGPGMILEAYSMLTESRPPTPASATRRIRNHTCHCGLHDQMVDASFNFARELMKIPTAYTPETRR
jgi:aerobic-type carbon monoxide dehydrogenase small subunit (CoxS/CutS family)